MKSADFDWLRVRNKITIMLEEVTYLVVFCPIMMDVWLISFISIYDILYFVKSTKITHK